MVFGILRFINFAHGDVFMMAGLFMFYLSQAIVSMAFATTLRFIIAIPVVILMTVTLSFIIERVAYKPLRNAPRMSVMVSAIAVSYLLRNLALYITGGLNRVYPPIPWLSDQVFFLGVAIKRVTVLTPILLIALVICLVWLIHHTKIGIAMRAVAKDFETSQLMGIKIDNVISITFVIGSFLAAVGSILFFTNFPGVTPFAGAMPSMKAFVAAVFGGIGSIPGAVLGGFIIGICESLIKGGDTILGPIGLGWIQTQWELATFSDPFTFFLLIIILLFKPTGLFGEKTTDKV
jgi:branched-chain amino acid transport system permease protein